MNLTFVIPYFYPAWQYGGQPRSAFELARGLALRGHRVKVLTTDSAGDRRLKAGRQRIEGVDVIYYRNLSNRLAFRQRLFLPPAMFRHMQSEMRGSDLLHIHELRSIPSLLAYRVARKLNIPFLLSGHGGLRRIGKENAKAIYDSLWGKPILENAATVLAISPLEEADALAMQVDPKRIRILPNMVNDADFQNLPPPHVFRERFHVGEGRLILFVGRLHRIKGADLLIEAFAALAEHDSKTRLVIAGPDDGHESQLRASVESKGINARVTFTGFLSPEVRTEAMVAADLVVVPSRSEVFALTAVEALMCGTPVLMSDACGLFPRPGRDEGVITFKSEDSRRLSDQLAVALADRPLKAGAARGCELVRREFGVERISELAEAIYLEAVSTPESTSSFRTA